MMNNTQQSAPFTVVIAGRTNVGKSTLFNRLIGKKLALVDPTPGVTRDRREGEGRIASLSFRLIDTAGLEEAAEESLTGRMMKQTAVAVQEADVCLLMIDGIVGLTPADEHFAKQLRKTGKPVIVVVNKSEGKKAAGSHAEALTLGFEYTIAISAEHGEGMGDLYDALLPFVPEVREETVRPEDKPVQIAFVGRPNVGKSTLTNALLGQERVLTGPEAGITRDAITIPWEFEGRAIKLVDTAGVRKRARVEQKVEKLAVADTLHAIRFAHVVVLLLDAACPFEKQDLTIAEMAIREGRALVIGINKWDAVENKKEWQEELEHRVDTLLPQVRGVPMIMFSAEKRQNIPKLIRAALKMYDVWNKEISTTKLNQWLMDAETKHVPPLAKNNRPIRLKFIKQIKTRPPSFTIFANRPEDLPESYTRYLVHSLREAFDMPGVPIRVMWRKGSNPYQK